MCIEETVDVLIVIVRWPEVWGGGMCWSYWILGVEFCGAYRTDFLSPRQRKTWYLNYALVCLLIFLDASSLF